MTSEDSTPLPDGERIEADPDAEHPRPSASPFGPDGAAESLLRRTADGAYRLDADGTIVGATDAAAAATGYERRELLGRHVTDLLADEEAFETARDAAAAIEDGGGGELVVDLRTADGERRSFETRFAVDRDGSGAVSGVTGALYDVTDRVERERELAAKSRAMDEASIALCLTDPTRSDNPLVYVNSGFEALTGYDAEEVVGQNCRFLQGADTDPEAVDELREGVGEGRPVSTEILNYRADGEPFWNEVDVVPIYDDDGELVHFLGSQTDISARKADERRLRQQREQLVALNQINRIVRGINSALVATSTRREIERMVCDRLAETESYEAAWLGTADSENGEIAPRASANVDQRLLDIETAAFEAGERTPAIEAARTQEVQVVRDVSAYEAGSWRECVSERGYAAAVSVPIGFQEFQYDVLTIYTDREEAFTGEERDAVAQLQGIIGHAINAIERKQALLSNVVVQLEFTLRDVDSALTAATADGAAAVEYERTIPTDGGGAVLFVRVSGVDPEEMCERLERDPSVEHTRVVGRRDGEAVIEFRTTETPITATLASYGGQVTDAAIEDGEYRVVVELPHHLDVREAVSAIQRSYPGVELVAQRSTTRSVRTLNQFQSAIGERLTDKQRNALEAAYAAGYFAWPRESTGEEIADALGIAPATFHEHLRVGLRELLSASLDRSE